MHFCCLLAVAWMSNVSPKDYAVKAWFPGRYCKTVETLRSGRESGHWKNASERMVVTLALLLSPFASLACDLSWFCSTMYPM